MSRENSDYLYNFGINSLVFKDDESKTEAKTNSGHRVCPLLVGSPILAYTEHAQRPLSAYCVSTYTHTHTFHHGRTQIFLHTFLLRSSILEWSTLST